MTRFRLIHTNFTDEFSAPAHLLRPPQDVKKDFLRLITPNVCASQGTTVVLIKKSLASPKKFLQPKKRDFMG